MALCADAADDTTGARAYKEQALSLYKQLFTDFWNPRRQAFVHSRIAGVQGDKITRYTNMFSIIFGYATEPEAVMAHVLLNDSIQQITTPYMQFYELEALCAMGDQRRVLKRIKEYWGGMLSLGATSFWEKYDPAEKGAQHYAMYGRPFGRSLCHAWGASPLYLLGKYYLGVRPISPGYSTYEVIPVLGGLQWMEGAVPTPHGNIKLYCSRARLQIHAVTGLGVLRFQSKTRPVCKEGSIRAIGDNRYEMMLTNKDYTINYAAID
jgi:hypothetical protein